MTQGSIDHETDDNLAVSAANVESDSCNAPLGQEETPRFNSPVSIHIHSIRKRSTDADGISAKAVIDGIVRAGILIDDSPQYVKEVSYSQEKGKEEKTIITIQD